VRYANCTLAMRSGGKYGSAAGAKCVVSGWGARLGSADSASVDAEVAMSGGNREFLLEFACWLREFGPADVAHQPRRATDRTAPASV